MTERRELLLAIDTSAATSVAVVDSERGVLIEANGADTMKHAEVIGRLIERALADSEVTASRITGVVIGMGPGPFTGLRVGIAAAHAFALGRGVPLLPLVSHDAVARVAAEGGATGSLLVVSDARRREFYWSLYDLGAAPHRGSPTLVDGPGLAKREDLPHQNHRTLEVTEVSAGALGEVAVARLASGAAFAADEALYLRSPDVTISSGVKRVTQR